MSYDAPPPAYGGGPTGAQDHPKATTVLVLGIVGLFCCGPAGIVAWLMGNGAMKEVEAGRYNETPALKWGRIIGMVAGILWVLGVLLFIILLATGAATFSGNVSSS